MNPKKFKPGTGSLDLEELTDYIIKKLGKGQETPEQYHASKALIYIGAAAVFHHIIPFMERNGKEKVDEEIHRLRQQIEDHVEQIRMQSRLVVLPNNGQIIQ